MIKLTLRQKIILELNGRVFTDPSSRKPTTLVVGRIKHKDYISSEPLRLKALREEQRLDMWTGWPKARIRLPFERGGEVRATAAVNIGRAAVNRPYVSEFKHRFAPQGQTQLL